nr:SGNH/GDSL hydrolase family protein [uncultured Acetatifactor sp.]
MRYLFQGDSITDCGRGDYSNPYATGCGYPRLLEADLMAKDGNCEVMNCGISGNRVVDLLARWKKDCLNLKPDVITILIGVNDVWHELGECNGVDTPLFEEVYRILLRETKAALPDARIVLMGAYVMHGPATDPEWETFNGEVGARREATRRLAEEFGTVYVDLQQVFDEAQKKFPASRWSGDGVHPTAAGHEIIARAWMEAVGV